MKRFTLYKHINNTDIAFMPINMENLCTDIFLVTGHWFNITNPNGIFYVKGDVLHIKYKDLPNWKEYPDTIDAPRKS